MDQKMRTDDPLDKLPASAVKMAKVTQSDQHDDCAQDLARALMRQEGDADIARARLAGAAKAADRSGTLSGEGLKRFARANLLEICDEGHSWSTLDKKKPTAWTAGGRRADDTSVTSTLTLYHSLPSPATENALSFAFFRHEFSSILPGDG